MPADTVTIPAAELAALRAVATSAREWQLGRISGIAHADTIRTHLPALNLAPGRTEAWPEQDRDPVPGVDYLPRVGEWGYARDAEDADGPAHNRHLIGYSDPDGDHWYDRSGAEVRAA